MKFLLILFICTFVGGRRVRDTECYGDFGCFNSDGHIPVPQSPQRVNTHLNLYTRSNSHHPAATLDVDHYDSQIGHFTSTFDGSKDTKVVIHGYLDDGRTQWVSRMISELLKKGDFNVIVVDWGTGSKQAYSQAVGNTFLVGAEVAEALTYLHDHRSLDYSKVHIIGHSLGAQTAGHIGHRVRGIGRITGLDPADPDFRGKPTDRRLDSSDATLVDVIHTDGSGFNGVSGYGLIDPVGDMDFYPNSGQHQPGCDEKPLLSAIDNIIHGGVSGAVNSITCSHSRAVELFIESINSACKFYGHTCSSASQFENGACVGCPQGGCPPMGYDADQSTQRGSFYLSTSGASPFCSHEYYVEIHFSHFLRTSYGELLVTLVGSGGHSEQMKFSPRNEYFRHDQVEKHVIGTHTDIGTITSVRVRYDEPDHDSHTSHTGHEVRVWSLSIEPLEDPSKKIKFCAYNGHIHADSSTILYHHNGC